MTNAAARFERAKTVAFEINAHLPPDYQAELLGEQLRVDRDRLVLVVGGAGYIGSVLCGDLLAKGYRVRNLDLVVYNNGVCVAPWLGHPNYQFMGGDLADEATFVKALDGVTDVVLLAGLVGDPVTKNFPDAAARINDEGHSAMLRLLAGKGLNRVVFVSTCSNYGLIQGDQLADEDFELSPLSLYAKSKVRVEQTLLGGRGKVDYTPVVLRFATAFGLSPRMRFDLTVSEFTRAMALGEDLLVFDAHTWRPYCHVRDFAELIRRAIEAPAERVAFEVFNAGRDVNNKTKQMIVDAILTQLPEAKVRYQEHGSDPRNYRVDFTKVKERLHFVPKWTVEDGVAELIDALKQGLYRDIAQPTSFHGNWEPQV
ncbi:NAD-dependent epimerase/dehydratase [Paramagnetospirillum kuznetsovii]|uniref:NAD-dependent epimerase/dehydratase n=1 Tax=Paramagnetospirillum kuznetsovii TaxID=2053833 RepID=A0A364P2I6_9PROT|nr:NAD(P)-dependent oxidoreductase [Paramagnetospirillum kuznetsovii]RAU23544.1 NAD-dependent epimerase/dehydratase [Paramagnetospirillum kuznetsovii]